MAEQRNRRIFQTAGIAVNNYDGCKNKQQQRDEIEIGTRWNLLQRNILFAPENKNNYFDQIRAFFL